MMNTYTFKYQNNKGGLYFLSAILGVPLLIPFSGLLLLDYVPWIFWITIPLGIVLIVYCIRQFIRKSKGMDTITVDDEGFTSKDYGRVLYSNIHSIPPYGALQVPPPSMRIKLHSGKKLVWIFNPKSPKTRDDIATFTGFRDELLAHLKRQALSKVPVRTAEEAETAKSSVQHAPEQGPIAPAGVIEQLERHRKRDFKYKYVTIPLGLAFAVLTWVRACGEDMIREHKNKEFEGVRNSILRAETDYEDNIGEALHVAKTYARKFGPVSLFTNDPQAVMEFIPDIRKDPLLPEINVIGLRRVEDNEQLEKFIRHPDSVNYDLAVINTSLKFSAVMSKSPFGKEDSTAAVVYFAVYNPNESLPSKYRSPSDTSFHPIHYTSSINIPKGGRLTKAVLKNMDFASVRAILRKYEGTHFYMAVKEKDGISPGRFEELEDLVRTDFKEQGMSTDQFQSMRFNE